MATANWQGIPVLIEFLRRIEPRRVAEVGTGSGRWAVLLRELAATVPVGAGEQECELVGIVPSELGSEPACADAYQAVRSGNPAELFERSEDRFDVAIFDGTLSLLERSQGLIALEAAVARTDYVIVHTRIGDLPFDGGWAARSVWEADDFDRFGVVRRVLMRDGAGAEHGAFVLSTHDPKDLRANLASLIHEFPSLAGVETRADEYRAGLAELVRGVEDATSELSYIKQHSTYRIGAKLRERGAWNALRWIRNRNDRVVTVRALGSRHPLSKGSEVWMLEASPNSGGKCIPWQFIETDRSWQKRENKERAYGHCVYSNGGMARIPVDQDPELKFLSHGWSGKVEIAFRGRREVVDLYSPGSDVVTVHPARTPMTVRSGSATESLRHPVTISPPAPLGLGGRVPAPGSRFSEAESGFIERFRAANGQVLAVTCPRWLGVTSSTRGVFEHVYHVPARREDDPYTVNNETLQHHAEVILATGTDHVVLSGGDEFQVRLLRMLKAASPGLRVDLFYHASYVQFCEDYTWSNFKLWVEAARSGEVYCLASDKWGWDEFCASLGVQGAVLLNRVEGSPMDPPALEGAERQIGVWLSGSVYRKIPHAMLSAIRMMPNCRLHGAGLDRRALEVVEFLKIPVAVAQEHQFPHDELNARMRQTHLTMYVTFVECCPMLPLESLRLGVPALTGPNSHLFEDHPYLFSRLVVPFPDRAEVIAKYAETALAEREQIIDEYKKYHPLYEARCRESLQKFLRM